MKYSFKQFNPLTGTIPESSPHSIDAGYLAERARHLLINRNRNEIELIIKEINLKYVYDLFLFYEQEYKPTYKRQQLWKEMKGGLCEVICGGVESLEKAVWQVRNRLRYLSNRIPNRCISRTVLLKGLECDHAIIIKPELFDAKNLYVALTRASSMLTIISNESSWCNY